jgi:hypothetical protein
MFQQIFDANVLGRRFLLGVNSTMQYSLTLPIGRSNEAILPFWQNEKSKEKKFIKKIYLFINKKINKKKFLGEISSIRRMSVVKK